ncbi:hypoxanthine phosphoribosyltransferase [Siculibacillus lacustris]|uniref:Hypoxanthine phosphoribosyltransferase n=1 Tax=Siculibacillus lacustris TaxID=1549641 RepID=A0A4Q9VG47_9HYPH|nr:hypoxanthine phosphoribosyltransferase [Siculibacillus lacustris]TBW33959.1 hypoxanthine phosphoribosyltransferase [Siculibacillus lacustris]
MTARRIDILFSAEAIAERNRTLAAEIRDAGFRDDVLVVAVLKGGFVFAADLIRALHGAGISPEVDFMSLSSYRAGTESSGHVTVLRDLETDVVGRNVLLVDDILESGRTLAFARQLMIDRGAARVGIAVLLDKHGRRAVPFEGDFVGFVCPDLFVVGYGMDMGHAYRELPYIGHVVAGDDRGPAAPGPQGE